MNNQDIPHRGCRFPLDAQCGIPGLPQSATGHTTIYSGINSAKVISKHLYGFPNQELRTVLKRRSLFVHLVKNGYTCKFINAFRPIFFTTPELFKNLHMSATTEMNKYAGLPFSDFSMIKNSKALYHDFSNHELRKIGFQLPVISAEEAGGILVNESRFYDLILYEYFLTDFAGHSQNLEVSIEQILRVEQLILSVLEKIDRKNTILVVISDHGNIEDLRTKSHTNNPAFLAIWDYSKQISNIRFTSLKDIFPYIIYKITGTLPPIIDNDLEQTDNF